LYKSAFEYLFFSFPLINAILYLYHKLNPNDESATINSYKISVKDFAKRYSDYLFLIDVEDNIITHRSILYYMIDEYLLLDDVNLSIKTQIGFFNIQSHLPRILKAEKFLFQLTNFIT
jgi:hypothetical protein